MTEKDPPHPVTFAAGVALARTGGIAASTARSMFPSLWWWASPSLRWLVSSWWRPGSSSFWRGRCGSSTTRRTPRTRYGEDAICLIVQIDCFASAVKKYWNRFVKKRFWVNLNLKIFLSSRRGDSVPTLERATKFNPMFESDPVTAQYYRRYDDEMPQYYRRYDPDLPQYSSSGSADGSKDLSSDEIQHIYQNTSLTKEVRNVHEHICIFF